MTEGPRQQPEGEGRSLTIEEARSLLIKRVKRAAFGFTSFRNYRIRSLLYAGKPNWDLLATITPR
jgi:hypothetical protein